MQINLNFIKFADNCTKTSRITLTPFFRSRDHSSTLWSNWTRHCIQVCGSPCSDLVWNATHENRFTACCGTTKLHDLSLNGRHDRFVSAAESIKLEYNRKLNSFIYIVTTPRIPTAWVAKKLETSLLAPYVRVTADIQNRALLVDLYTCYCSHRPNFLPRQVGHFPVLHFLFAIFRSWNYPSCILSVSCSHPLYAEFYLQGNIGSVRPAIR